jgi:uncharacterized protein YeaO (DUF488 family)
MRLKIKRAYEPAAKSDGRRILIDRLWPRGLTRDVAGIDEWAKDLSPSTALRRWFNHDPKLWAEFVDRYREELSAPAARLALGRLRTLASSRQVTLVYAASNREYNNAVALCTILDGMAAPRRKGKPC